MITQVSGLSVNSVTKDPRRKAQSVKFRNHSRVPYTHNYEEQYARQQKNALLTSVSVVAGSVLFTVGYFLLSSLKRAKALAK